MRDTNHHAPDAQPAPVQPAVVDCSAQCSPAEVPPDSPNPLQNALEVWDGEAGVSSPALSLVRLGGDETLLVPFTSSMLRVKLHYLDSEALRGYVHCEGGDCLLCRLGRRADVRDLLPIYDPVARAVKILAVSGNLRPHALRPLLAPILRRLGQDGRVILGVRKPDSYHFDVATLELPEDAEDGAAEITAFRARMDSGSLDLGSVYPRLANEELAGLPEIAREIQLRGITLP